MNSGRILGITYTFFLYIFSNKGITVLYKISGIKEGEIPKSWMKGHELFKNIYLLGKLPYYENIMEMSKSDILFHPSLEEALPGPILEGMALNKPVIAAEEAGGSKWLLDNGKYGILTKGKSVKIMSEDLIALVDKIIEGRYDASIAYEWIRDICDPNIIIEQYEQTYKLAIKNCNSNHI